MPYYPNDLKFDKSIKEAWHLNLECGECVVTVLASYKLTSYGYETSITVGALNPDGSTNSGGLSVAHESMIVTEEQAIQWCQERNPYKDFIDLGIIGSSLLM